MLGSKKRTQPTFLLVTHPDIGPRLEGRDDRELFIHFGQRGNVMRYRLNGDDIVILRIWHALEERKGKLVGSRRSVIGWMEFPCVRIRCAIRSYAGLSKDSIRCAPVSCQTRA
jgi:hypothetical protein